MRMDMPQRRLRKGPQPCNGFLMLITQALLALSVLPLVPRRQQAFAEFVYKRVKKVVESTANGGDAASGSALSRAVARYGTARAVAQDPRVKAAGAEAAAIVHHAIAKMAFDKAAAQEARLAKERKKRAAAAESGSEEERPIPSASKKAKGSSGQEVRVPMESPAPSRNLFLQQPAVAERPSDSYASDSEYSSEEDDEGMEEEDEDQVRLSPA